MKKVIIALSVVLCIVILVSINPLRRSCEHIRGKMLKDTPVGTSKEIVLEFIEDKGWRWDVAYGNSKEETGYHYISAVIGEYLTPFITSVVVEWKFNDEDTLIDVFVKKETDSL